MRKILNGKSGSTLIWALVIMVVLALILAIGLSIVQGKFTRSVNVHVDNQAYYTALSATDSVANWIRSGTASTPADTDVQTFLSSLGTATDKKMTFDLPAANLPENAGACNIVVQYTDTANNKLKITSKATYQDSTETVSLTLTGSTGASLDSQSPSLTEAVFPEKPGYDDYAAELNGLSNSSLVRIGDNYDYNTSSRLPENSNNPDKAILDAASIDANSTKEALYQSADRSSYIDSLGTALLSSQGSGANYNDSRRFLVPANGRLTINPIRGYSYTADSTNSTNTIPNGFSVGGVPGYGVTGKDVKIRLGGNSESGAGLPTNTNYNDMIKNRGLYPHALVTFDFPEQTTTTNDSDVRYYPENIYTPTPQNSYHPIDWHSGTVYTQYTPGDNANDLEIRKGLPDNIALGAFIHKFNSYCDYWSWGRYTGNPWFGQTSGTFLLSQPQMSSGSGGAGGKTGMPFIPQYYNNFNFYMLDYNSAFAPRAAYSGGNATILQGVNIFDGTIYSYRGVTLGSGLVKSSSIRNTMNYNGGGGGGGYDYGGNANGNYWCYTLRWDQVIKDTDIVLLRHPANTEYVYSYIRTPDSAANATSTVDNMTQNFHPTEKIIGGTIYVGAGQTLTIERGVTVKPEKIIVDGGTLIIRGSSSTDTFNLEAPVYVKGDTGSVVLEANTKIKADIYVYGGASLQIASSVTWVNNYTPGPASFLSSNAQKNISVTPFTEDGGIFIFGPNSKDVSGTLVGAGHLWNIKSSGYLNSINMTADKIHMLGGAFINDINTQWKPNNENYKTELTDATMNNVFCSNRYLAPGAATPAAKFDDPAYNDCLDFAATIGGGGWTKGEYSDE